MAYLGSDGHAALWPFISAARKTMKWSLKFEDAIVLKNGQAIKSLIHARDFMAGLPPYERQLPHWECAADLTFEAAHEHDRASIERARAQLVLSLRQSALV